MKELEKLIDAVCRSQPALKAPDTLVTRVLAGIAQRQALPWWRLSFAHWPMAMRMAFVATCAAIAWISLAAPVATRVNEPTAWAQHAGANLTLFGSVFSHVGMDLAHSISPLLLYGAALGICGLYLLLAGIAATTYRTLYTAN